MMTKIVSAFACLGLIAMGCASGADTAESEDAASVDNALSGSATLNYTSDTGKAYCVNVSLTNALTLASPRWQVAVDIGSGTLTSTSSNAHQSTNTGKVMFTPTSSNTSIAPGSAVTFNFCASTPVSPVRPVVLAYNFESVEYATCSSNSGLFPTKAALAVAMASELGRWTPATDLAISGTKYTPSARVVLSSAGLSACKNGCPNTKAILAQQDATWMDNTVFSVGNYISDLQNSFDRQTSLLTDLSRNNKAALPPAHKLTLVSGPVNLGVANACGPHYIFQVDTTTGVPLTTTQAQNMVNTMCFYGAGSCGSNPYIGFQVTQSNGCPSGKTCIAIDPTDGDNGSTSTTSAGSAPSYPMNRCYDPTNSLLGSACITSAKKLGTMVSKCSTSPTTCGYLYCI